ncbi:MAG: RuBisCO large subunit C-terminal-like domain-containing protein [Candidatus Jordarchaeales archaeon]
MEWCEMGGFEYEYIDAPEALPEGFDPEEYVVATYYVSLPAGLDANVVAQAAAIEQSTGTWTPVPKETPEVKRKHAARVIGVYEAPSYQWSLPKGVEERQYIIQIAFPLVNLCGSQFPVLLATVAGNILAGGKIKLLDITFPRKFVEGFKGAKFGIEGVRKILGVKDRPLINNMIKPCVYSPPDIGAELAYEVAAGGVDIIKDDELLADMELNRVEDRVVKFMEAIDRANEEKGEKTLYTVNITDRPSRVLELADRVIELGGNALMVDAVPVGFETLRDLAEDPSINVPILAHLPDFTGAIYMSPEYGLSAHLIMGKFPRMAGADIVVYPAPYGKAPFLRENYIKIAKVLRYPFYHLKKVFPMPSGGIIPSHVPLLVFDLGPDIVIGVGGGIHAHPQGPRAGAMAFRQAVEATMKGIPLEEAAKEHKELDVALKTWKATRIV